MERREFLKGVLPAAGGVVAVVTSVQPQRRIGLMDVARWHAEGYYEADAKVFLDGEDITYGCQWFDDGTGEAQCLEIVNGEFTDKTFIRIGTITVHDPRRP